MPTVALVVNAGSRRGAGVSAHVAELLAARDDAPEVASYDVLAGQDLAAALDEALVADPDLLVVGGGDGTVSCAAGRVAGTGTTLGVLPLGTANDFARTLEIPVHLPDAVDTLLSGKVVDVDLGRLNGHPFVNVASMGLSVVMTQKLSSRLKKVVGPVAYPVATLRAYRSLDPFTARLEFPDGDHETLELHDLLQLAIGNGRHYGGGATVAPNASVDDQLLDVVAIERGRLRDHVSVVRLLKSGSFVEHETVHHLTTRRVRVVTDDTLGVNLDGEVVTTTPADVTLEPNAVRVVVPQASRAAELDVEQPAEASRLGRPEPMG
jgi:YegS/Rv2252/BmrU family lipid kinase